MKAAMNNPAIQIELAPEPAPAPPRVPDPPAPQPPKPRPVLKKEPVHREAAPVSLPLMAETSETPAVNDPAAPPQDSGSEAPAAPDRAAAGTIEAQYAATLRTNIDARTVVPDSIEYRLRRPKGETRVNFTLDRAGSVLAARVDRTLRIGGSRSSGRQNREGRSLSAFSANRLSRRVAPFLPGHPRVPFMNYPLLHTVTFNVLYASACILIFVIFERTFYLSYLAVRSARIAREIARSPAVGAAPAMPDRKSRDPITQAVGRYLNVASRAGVTRGQLEDYSAALYIEVDKKISARLWILDTIITAAPLLGLLGTIFGIMQTFTALSEGGVSDPAEVSRGIGLALTATAIGIAVALVGLVGHNVLNRRAQLLTESFKVFVLRLTPAAS